MNDRPLRFEDVKQALKVWHVMFPGNRSDEEMEVLFQTYFASISKRMSQKVFFIAAERAQTGTSWFPTISEILIHRDDVIAEINRQDEYRNKKQLTYQADQRTEQEESVAFQIFPLIRQILKPGVDKKAIERKVCEIVREAQNGA